MITWTKLWMVRLQKQSFKTNLSAGWQVWRAYWTLSSWNWKRRKELFSSFLIKLFAIKDLLCLGFPNQMFMYVLYYIQNGPHNLLLIQFLTQSWYLRKRAGSLDVIFIPEVVRYYSRRKWRWMGGSISRLKARPIWLCRVDVTYILRFSPFTPYITTISIIVSSHNATGDSNDRYLRVSVLIIHSCTKQRVNSMVKNEKYTSGFKYMKTDDFCMNWIMYRL